MSILSKMSPESLAAAREAAAPIQGMVSNMKDVGAADIGAQAVPTARVSSGQMAIERALPEPPSR